MDDCLLYVGTDTRCHAYELRDGKATKVGTGLDGNAVRQISVHPDDPREALVACGLRGWGLHRTRNAGESWESLGYEESWVWGVERDPTDPDTVYVGTEPPMLYRSRDGGESFESFDAISDLPSSDQWTFFHEPFEAGHVHGIAIDPENPDRVFAGVEHGGFVFTYDGGETWDDSLAGYDVHDTAVVPGTDRVLVAAGEGLLVSDDAGEEFDRIVGFEDDYVEQFLEVGDRIYVDATAGSGSADATIAYTDDGGDSWHRFEGVPDVSVTGCNLLAAHGDTLFHARDEDGESEVVATDDGGDTWIPVGPSHGKIRAIAAAPLP
ncbi:WD40/YVTN/BNR-like repeat-containing protein [Halobacterium zhouii]|uniref:WD40/YVTN/BNR-like repeat-containing protein n=1 Tax=Halobacterium zhouii TaxID=2902624 RepID=UPI001E472EAF|nr:hypothetical protein [Halobacterium zhouii]